MADNNYKKDVNGNGYDKNDISKKAQQDQNISKQGKASQNWEKDKNKKDSAREYGKSSGYNKGTEFDEEIDYEETDF